MGRTEAPATILASSLVALAFWWFRLQPEPDARFSPDLYAQLYPMWHRAGEWMRAGHLPLWNPYQMAGHPFLASVLYGVLYPLNLTRLWMPADVALEVGIVVHQTLTLAFTFCLLRAWQCSRRASALGAASFACSNWFVGEAGWFTAGIVSAPWLSLGLLAVERIASGRGRWIAGLAVAVAMPILAGWLQGWLYNAYLIVGFAAVRLWPAMRARDPLRPVAVAGGFLLGIGIAAPQLLPSVELQRLGPRAAGALDLRDTLAFGSPGVDVLWQWITTGPGAAYVGVAPLLLWPLSLFTRRAVVFYLLGLAVLALLVSMGTNTPIIWAYWMLPGTSWFRIPHRTLYLFVFAVSVLGAIGLDQLARLTRAWVASLVVALALLNLFTYQTARIGKRPFHDVGAFDRSAAALDFIRERQRLDRTLIAWPDYFAPDAAQKQATLRGLYGITDYEVLSLGRTAEFFRPMEGEKRKRRFQGFLDFSGTEDAVRRLQLMSARFALVSRFRRDQVEALARAGWRQAMALDGLPAWSVYEAPHVLPRAYVARSIITPNGARPLDIIASRGFDPFRSAVIEGDGVSSQAGGAIIPATITQYEPDTVELVADSDMAGMLVLTDTHYPGWVATVDGVEAPIHRANELFRAVPVAAGRHVVRFTFKPRSFRVGAALAALSLLALVWAVSHRRSPFLPIRGSSDSTAAPHRQAARIEDIVSVLSGFSVASMYSRAKAR